MVKFLKHKKPVSIDCIDFDASNVSTGQIGSYIKYLYNEYDFRHIGYRFENRDGNCRWIIYTLSHQKRVIQYFKDRCPAMVESECRMMRPIDFCTQKWENGFEEVCAD